MSESSITLTVGEHSELGCTCRRVQGERRWHPVGCPVPVIERIIAARVAAARADERERGYRMALDDVWAQDHRYDGSCPDMEQPDERDDYCPACQRMVAALAQPADTKADDR